jgi:hypothetical protein
MHKAEKLTVTFVLKLGVLSVLLIFGAMIQSPKSPVSTNIQVISDRTAPTTSVVDTLQVNNTFIKLVKNQPVNSSSI